MLQNISEAITAEYCRVLFLNRTTIKDTVNLCCGYSYDGIKQWLPTPAASYASQQCPQKVLNSDYNINENATRYCLPSGKWENKTDYERCIFKVKDYNVLVIWFTGYTVSMMASSVALILLRYFRSLRCLRNEIHCNLIVSYIVRVIMWYVNVLPQMLTPNWPVVLANLSKALLMFLTTANFFWMFVEGLYLFTVIVWTYGIEKYNIWHYSIVGWGIPFLLTITATLATIFMSDNNAIWIQTNSSIDTILFSVIHFPILVSIIINVCFMFFIIYTLVKKLKEMKLPFRKHDKKSKVFPVECKKAIKAALVLIPLLGMAHCLVMFKPRIKQSLPIYEIVSASLTSTQGFFVALIYCFLNREVRHVIGTKYRIFRGVLSSNNRMRQTLEDSGGSIRRSTSQDKVPNHVETSQFFPCRNQKTFTSDITVETIPMICDGK